MDIKCPQCSATYRVPSKGAGILAVECGACGHRFGVDFGTSEEPQTPDPTPAPEETAPPPAQMRPEPSLKTRVDPELLKLAREEAALTAARRAEQSHAEAEGTSSEGTSAKVSDSVGAEDGPLSPDTNSPSPPNTEAKTGPAEPEPESKPQQSAEALDHGQSEKAEEPKPAAPAPPQLPPEQRERPTEAAPPKETAPSPEASMAEIPDDNDLDLFAEIDAELVAAETKADAEADRAAKAQNDSLESDEDHDEETQPDDADGDDHRVGPITTLLGALIILGALLTAINFFAGEIAGLHPALEGPIAKFTEDFAAFREWIGL